jgi:glycosyltransferase involved in cell wall biosynthesis
VTPLAHHQPLHGAARQVLFVVDSLEVGGAERVAVGLAAALVERGHRVTIACSAGGALVAEAEAAGVEVHVLGRCVVKRRVDLGFAERLGRLVVAKRPQVLHSHMFASSAAASTARPAGVPLVVHEHSEATWRDDDARRVSAAVYADSAAVIAVSAAIRQRLVDCDGVAPGKVHLLPNRLTVPYRPTRRPTLPRPAGPLVGVIARLQPEKGVEVFLHMAAEIRRSVPDAAFVVVGDGPLRAGLERLAADLAVPATFMGFRADAPNLVGELDLLVVPSLSEGTPLVVLEAAAAGVPIVASAVGGIPEQVRPGVEALLAPAGDAPALASAARRVLGDEALAARLVRAARARLGEQSGPAATVEAVEDIYSTATDLPPLARPRLVAAS